MVNQPGISAVNLSLGYKNRSGVVKVINGATFQFSSSELIGIAGLNGTGKSTLLKGLCGALPVMGGNILIQDQNIQTISLNELAKKISIVLTEKIRGFNLTVHDLVAAGQIPYTNSFHNLETKHLQVIAEAIHLTGIKEHEHKQLNELSDGLFQKAVIAKALAQQTEVLLLDEPTAYLDYASKHNLFQLLTKLCNEQSKCVLVSSHELDLLLKYCTKILVISTNGLEVITVEQARSNPAFLEIGGGYL